MKSSLEGPVADQVLAEAAENFIDAIAAPLENEGNATVLPGEAYSTELNEAIIILAGVARALDRTEPWAVASKGVRKISRGLDTTKLFADPKLQKEIMRDVAKRKAIFEPLEKDWFTQA